MKKILHAITVILLLFLTFSTVFAVTVSPSDVRSYATGSTVTVTGYAFSGTDSDSTGFRNEFYLSDPATARGICVTLSRNEKITLYKEYSVTGTLQKIDGELKIQNALVTPLSGSATRKFKRHTYTEALNYESNSGTFTRLSGTATEPMFKSGYLSYFMLTDGENSIKIVIEENVLSSSKGREGKTELTELLKYKREVTVDGFIAKMGSETVIRIKDCDDIDVQYHVCVFGTVVTEKVPSCDAEGLSVKVCKCGKREETVIPKKEHSYKERTEITPTCTKEGLRVRYCENCSFREESTLPKKNHSYSEKTERAATCYSEGIYVRYCSSCDFREETTIPKKEHSYKERTEITPTCTREGLRVRYCENCSFREKSTLPKKNHSYSEKTERAATCYSEGIYVRYCSSCDFREETTIPKKEHSYKERTEKTATCTAEGLKIRYCSNCDFKESTVIPKIPHSYKESTEKKATCTEEGILVSTCKVCGEQEKSTLPKLSHLYENTVKKASFTQDGSISYKCKNCDDIKENTVIPAVSECSLSNDTFVYNGKNHAPTVSLKDKNGKAVTDFNTTCDTAKEIGKYTVTVELKGNYTGKKTLYFTVIPANVTDLKAVVIANQATVTFKESSKADGYRIYYQKGSKLESLVTSTKATCSITLPDCGKSYTLVIKSYKKTDDATLWSSGVSAVISTGPHNVTNIKSDSNYYSVTLKWDKTETADGYRVYIKNSSGNFKILTTGTKTSYTAKGLSGDTKYTFAVKSYRKVDGKTIWGKATKKTVSTLSGKPASFSYKESYYSVALSWREVKGADGYKVYVYSGKKKKYVTLKSLSGNKYTAENLSSGTTYKFAMKPYAKEGSKVYYGEPVYLTVTTKLARPTLSAVSKGNKGNYLSWKKVSGADGYEVYYCYQKDGKFKKLKTTSALTFLHSNASKTKSCYYKIRAYKTVSGTKLYSSFSTVKKVTR